MPDTEKKIKISLAQQVHDDIMEMLIKGELRPGDKVPEEKISEMLQVSRTPIREGIRMLAAEGLVKMRPNRVAEIIEFTREDMHDLGMIRLTHDILAGKLAIYNGSNADFQALSDIAEECEIHIKNGDAYNRILADARFHNKLAEIAGNPILLRFQKELYQKICLYQAVEYSKPVEQENLSHHGSILKALMNRDEQAYMQAIREHLIDYYDLQNSKYKFLVSE